MTLEVPLKGFCWPFMPDHINTRDVNEYAFTSLEIQK